jgi:hypothetical protein
MEQFYKFWRVLLKNNARWDCGLGIAGENNETVGGRWYMTNTAGWFCMLALAGVWIDIPEKELMLAPNLPSQMGNKLEAIPVFGNTFKAKDEIRKAGGKWIYGRWICPVEIKGNGIAAKRIDISSHISTGMSTWKDDGFDFYEEVTA